MILVISIRIILVTSNLILILVILLLIAGAQRGARSAIRRSTLLATDRERSREDKLGILY